MPALMPCLNNAALTPCDPDHSVSSPASTSTPKLFALPINLHNPSTYLYNLPKPLGAHSTAAQPTVPIHTRPTCERLRFYLYSYSHHYVQCHMLLLLLLPALLYTLAAGLDGAKIAWTDSWRIQGCLMTAAAAAVVAMITSMAKGSYQLPASMRCPTAADPTLRGRHDCLPDSATTPTLMRPALPAKPSLRLTPIQHVKGTERRPLQHHTLKLSRCCIQPLRQLLAMLLLLASLPATAASWDGVSRAMQACYGPWQPQLPWAKRGASSRGDFALYHHACKSSDAADAQDGHWKPAQRVEAAWQQLRDLAAATAIAVLGLMVSLRVARSGVVPAPRYALKLTGYKKGGSAQRNERWAARERWWIRWCGRLRVRRRRAEAAKQRDPANASRSSTGMLAKMAAALRLRERWATIAEAVRRLCSDSRRRKGQSAGTCNLSSPRLTCKGYAVHRIGSAQAHRLRKTMVHMMLLVGTAEAAQQHEQAQLPLLAALCGMALGVLLVMRLKRMRAAWKYDTGDLVYILTGEGGVELPAEIVGRCTLGYAKGNGCRYRVALSNEEAPIRRVDEAEMRPRYAPAIAPAAADGSTAE